ncbi:cytochrome P450 82A3-like [Abrus precatorius]|uniref:Cytochrome P450 82A3-like n=1 Tax=Abrus precatorius TaxID=3816 RepID=A0A8B8LSB9_ABRPR|nr:cytochrome P450 82A3-like [Abrus precatorius]
MDLVLNCLNTTTIALFSLIVLCLFLYRRSKGREAPTVSGAWPILGHLKLLSASQTPHRTIGALADKYGPLFTIKLGVKPALVLSNWEMAKECFTTNDIAVSSRPKLVAVELMSYNQAFVGLAPYGSYWRELRKIVTFEFLSNRRIEQLSHVRVSEVQTSIKELFNVWRSKKNESNYALVEMKQWFAHLTFNMVIRMVAGKRYFGAMDEANEEKAKRFMENIREFMRLMGTFTVADGAPFLRWLDLGGYEKAMKATAKKFDKVLSEWLEEHKQNKALGGKAEGDRDFMDVMLSALNGTQIDGFDADTICKATTLELFLGGTDTTAVTLTWALCLLLRSPHVLEKVKEEINMHFGKEGSIGESDINKLAYLQAVVKETLRLYPPAPLSSPREFTENCTIGGYHVKKGTRLIPNLWKIHRDPSVWSDPLEFKPDRFLTTHKHVDVRGQNFEFLPFGSGRRICPGMSLGLHMVDFTLANFLHSFEIMNPSSEPIDMTEIFGFTNTKATPLEILVKPHLPLNYYEGL